MHRHFNVDGLSRSSLIWNTRVLFFYLKKKKISKRKQSNGILWKVVGWLSSHDDNPLRGNKSRWAGLGRKLIRREIFPNDFWTLGPSQKRENGQFAYTFWFMHGLNLHFLPENSYNSDFFFKQKKKEAIHKSFWPSTSPALNGPARRGLWKWPSRTRRASIDRYGLSSTSRHSLSRPQQQQQHFLFFSLSIASCVNDTRNQQINQYQFGDRDQEKVVRQQRGVLFSFFSSSPTLLATCQFWRDAELS